MNRGRTDNISDERETTKGQTKIYKTYHRKLKIGKHEPHQQPGVNPGAPEGFACTYGKRCF